jgi:hypothetical protein
LKIGRRPYMAFAVTSNSFTLTVKADGLDVKADLFKQ